MANGITGVPVQQVPANNYNVTQRRDNGRDDGDNGNANGGASARNVVAASQGGNVTATRGTIINITA